MQQVGEHVGGVARAGVRAAEARVPLPVGEVVPQPVGDLDGPLGMGWGPAVNSNE
ncbi:hypothetical protein [Thermoactinospora rubra]|uniref:hypothetical protein n=1 Tax=Thermoactinospora rubra TaxID=1088767 RepID=UPI001301A595|nr:hypothetical protein [Thermoactinospora rubra]